MKRECHVVALTDDGPKPGTNVWLLALTDTTAEIEWWNGARWAQADVPVRAVRAGRASLPRTRDPRDDLRSVRQAKLTRSRSIIGDPEGFYWNERFRERKTPKAESPPVTKSAVRLRLSERDRDIGRMRLEGYSLAAIAAKYSLSRERVRQIVDRRTRP